MMNAEIIKASVLSYLHFERNCPIIALEAFFGDMDVAAVTKAGYLIEVEVKMTLADLKRELKKDKHITRKKEPWETIYRGPVIKAAYYYIAIPYNLYLKSEKFIKESFPHYGILTVSAQQSYWESSRMGYEVAVRKSAKRLTKVEKLTMEQQIELASKQGNAICSLLGRVLKARRALGNGK